MGLKTHILEMEILKTFLYAQKWWIIQRLTFMRGFTFWSTLIRGVFYPVKNMEEVVTWHMHANSLLIHLKIQNPAHSKIFPLQKWIKMCIPPFESKSWTVFIRFWNARLINWRIGKIKVKIKRLKLGLKKKGSFMQISLTLFIKLFLFWFPSIRIKQIDYVIIWGQIRSQMVTRRY